MLTHLFYACQISLLRRTIKVSKDEFAMMKYNNVRHKKHILDSEKERVEMRKLLKANGLERFESKLHKFGLERASDLADLATIEVLREDIGMGDADIARFLSLASEIQAQQQGP